MNRNWLRGVGIVLLVMPEPFTTPLGITLLAASYLLPKRHKDNLRSLESIMKRYTTTMKTSGFNRLNSEFKHPIFHRLNCNLIKPQINKKVSVSSISSIHSKIPVNITGIADARLITFQNPVDRNSTIFQHRYLSNSHKVGDDYKALPDESEIVFSSTVKTIKQPPPRIMYYSTLQPIRWTMPAKTIHHSLKRY